MDRQTYVQLDRIEAKLEHIKDGIHMGLNFDSVDVLQDWYEAEVLAENGKLKHLRNDNILKAFIESLVEEEEPEPEQTQTEDEYKQN